MNKDKIREKIENLKSKKIKFKYNGARNQIEDFVGVIENTYNSIFTIKIDGTDTIKSFSYSDVINKNLQIFV